MLGLTGGELFVVVFIVVMVVSWSWWPRAGEAVAGLLFGDRDPDPPKSDPSSEGSPPKKQG